jgi:hypothetical protein
MKQSRSTWQSHERRIAGKLGTQRAGVGQPGADVVTDDWSLECKSWRTLPARVVAALVQAERSATAHQVAAAVIHQVGARHDKDLVVMRWADFDRLLLGDGRRDRYTAAQVAAAVDDDQDRAAVLTPRVRTDVLKSRDE